MNTRNGSPSCSKRVARASTASKGLSASAAGALDAVRRGRPCQQALHRDRRATVLAHAVAAVGQTLQSGVQLAEALLGQQDQRRDLLALERDRGAFRVVLVVG